jgi:hypothetical protein
MIASSHLKTCKFNLKLLRKKFTDINYPQALTNGTIDTAFEELIHLLPLPFSPVPGALAEAIDGTGWVLSLSLSLSHIFQGNLPLYVGSGSERVQRVELEKTKSYDTLRVCK